MVEKDRKLVENLYEQAKILTSSEAVITNKDAWQWLSEQHVPFDIVFLDPPFHENSVDKACALLLNSGNLKPGAKIYIECESELVFVQKEAKIIKQSTAGKVQYILVETNK